MLGRKTYTGQECALMLGVGYNGFLRLVRQGIAPPKLFKGRWSKAQIDQFLATGSWQGQTEEQPELADEAFGGA